MTFQQGICIMLVIAFIGIGLPVTNAKGKELNKQYHLEYDIIDDHKTIEFKLKASGVTGWIGIGINNQTRTQWMKGADIYMGGYDSHHNTGYSHGYLGVNNTTPKNNPHHIWSTVSITEEKGSTHIIVKRFLKVDDRYGVDIQNKTMYLIWAYNEHKDDTNEIHTARGHIKINFFDKHYGGANSMRCGFNVIALLCAFTTLSKLLFK